MPQGKQAKESVQPSRGFLSRIFGSDQFTPEMEEGIGMARREMPDMAPVEPYGFFSRLFGPRGALGYTSPNSNIYMNPAMNQGQSPQDIADTLTHEQEHVKQQKSNKYGPTMRILKSMISPPNEPYHRRPDEMAAFQAEKNRRFSMGRKQSPIPSFSTGEFYTPQDTNLPLPKLKR